jgi:hypothetical protein
MRTERGLVDVPVVWANAFCPTIAKQAATIKAMATVRLKLCTTGDMYGCGNIRRMALDGGNGVFYI